MSNLEGRLARIEGKLDADEYLIRHVVNRLLATSILDREHLVEQLKGLVAVGDQVASEVPSPEYAEAFRDRLQDILDDFKRMIAVAEGPQLGIIVGRKADK